MGNILEYLNKKKRLLAMFCVVYYYSLILLKCDCSPAEGGIYVPYYPPAYYSKNRNFHKSPVENPLVDDIKNSAENILADDITRAAVQVGDAVGETVKHIRKDFDLGHTFSTLGSMLTDSRFVFVLTAEIIFGLVAFPFGFFLGAIHSLSLIELFKEKYSLSADEMQKNAWLSWSKLLEDRGFNVLIILKNAAVCYFNFVVDNLKKFWEENSGCKIFFKSLLFLLIFKLIAVFFLFLFSGLINVLGAIPFLVAVVCCAFVSMAMTKTDTPNIKIGEFAKYF